MGWWPFSQPDEPPATSPDGEPDPGSVYCSCCPEHRGRWRFNDVLICAICDNPDPVLPGTVPPWKDPTS